MDEELSNTGRARSSHRVVEANDSVGPSYPKEAAEWVANRSPATVLELGAGIGKLTEQLVQLGFAVTATDCSERMLGRLAERAPGAWPVLASAESIPVASQSVDVVVAARAFDWLETGGVLHEIARVLKPRGTLGLLWNGRDERVPWVRRLGAILADVQAGNPTQAIDETGLFETVETATFRFWQPASRHSLRELVLSCPNVAVLSQSESEAVLRQVDELYDEYGRGYDGMLMPYVTHAYRTLVLPWAIKKADTPTDDPAQGPGDIGQDSLLIDFR